MVGGVIASGRSSSDFSVASLINVGVFGGGERLLSVSDTAAVFHTPGVSGVSGVAVSSEASRV